MVSDNVRHFRLIISVLFLCCIMAACGGSGSGGAPNPSGTAVGPEGGTVAVTEQGTPITGAKVYIPEGALDGDQVISLASTVLPKALPAGYRAAGPCVSFSPGGIVFKQPATLTLPYTDANNDGIVDGKAVTETKVKVLYYNETAGVWEAMPVQGTDAAGNLVMAQTGHFSTYLAAVNTGDSQPLDPGTEVPAAFTSGDCLVGTGNLLDPNGSRDSCYYFNLTVTRRENGLHAIVDRYATFVETGIPATVSPEGDSAVFDAASAFSKVQQSGSAVLWNWEGEFVQEHTYLKDYEVLDDALTGAADPAAGAIYCQVTAEDANMVRISWQIDLNEQIVYQMSPSGGGHCLVVRFRASYR